MVHSYILKGSTNRPCKFIETLNYMSDIFFIIRIGSAIFLCKVYMSLRQIISRRISLSEIYLLLTCFYRWQKMYQAPISFQRNLPTMSEPCLLQGWMKVVHPSNIDLSTLWLYNPKIKKNISYIHAGCWYMNLFYDWLVLFLFRI